jgi:alkylation response protein AidB-like acyl-CoA dehydrogenase
MEKPSKIQTKKIADLGLMGLTLPEKYGGSGKGTPECVEASAASGLLRGLWRQLH